jgi:hypothetical protein
MERYIGQIQIWASHLGARLERGAIYDTSQRRGNVGTPQHDFAFVEFTDPGGLQERLAELNR